MTNKRDGGGLRELRAFVAHLWDECHDGGDFEKSRDAAKLDALLASPLHAGAEPEEDESLHTGDDERIDALTNIVTGLEAMRDDPEDNADITFDSVIEDCMALDALIVATVKRERAAYLHREGKRP